MRDLKPILQLTEVRRGSRSCRIATTEDRVVNHRCIQVQVQVATTLRQPTVDIRGISAARPGSDLLPCSPSSFLLPGQLCVWSAA